MAALQDVVTFYRSVRHGGQLRVNRNLIGTRPFNVKQTR